MVFAQPQIAIEVTELLVKVHLRHFGGEKILMLMDPGEREDAFFRYDGGTMAKLTGYYIYYEKNSQMQTYMIERSQREGGKASEKVEDKAVRNFRKIIDSKKPEEREEKTSVFSYAATVCLALAVLVAGVNLYRNQQEKGVPEDYRAASASVVQITPVITEGTAARETQTPTPSVKAESRERITVTPAADPKKKETDSPENNVVETTVTEIPPGSADTEQAKTEKRKALKKRMRWQIQQKKINRRNFCNCRKCAEDICNTSGRYFVSDKPEPLWDGGGYGTDLCTEWNFSQ